MSQQMNPEILEYSELQAKSVNCHGREFLLQKDIGIVPFFTLELRRRINSKLACNVLVVGEARIGKSYMAMQIARNLNKRFTVNQVVYEYSDYQREIARRRVFGMPIVFDEPSYAMGKHEWYRQINQALVKTMESQGFKVRPVIIPVININLLDKTIRNYLIQFQVQVWDRGKARVYRLSPSQREDKTYYTHIGNLDYGLMDRELCSKESCLGCSKLHHECNIFRANYERKKETIQESRYEQDKYQASVIESSKMTLEQIEKKALELKNLFTEDERINPRKLRVALRENGITIGYNKSYEIKAILETHHPELFKSKNDERSV